ncbi:MAG: hypothetical protein ABI927_08475 [Gaiellaceae bacterium]
MEGSNLRIRSAGAADNARIAELLDTCSQEYLGRATTQEEVSGTDSRYFQRMARTLDGGADARVRAVPRELTPELPTPQRPELPADSGR